MFPLMLSFCGIGCALLMNLNTEGLLGTVLFMPLFGAFLLSLFPSQKTSAHRLTALFFSLVTFLLSLLLWASFLPNSSEPFQQMIGFAGSWKELFGFV